MDTDNMIAIDRFYSARAVGQALGVHERTVIRLIMCGELAGVRVGRQWRVSQSALDDFLRRARVRSEVQA